VCAGARVSARAVRAVCSGRHARVQQQGKQQSGPVRDSPRVWGTECFVVSYLQEMRQRQTSGNQNATIREFMYARQNRLLTATSNHVAPRYASQSVL